MKKKYLLPVLASIASFLLLFTFCSKNGNSNNGNYTEGNKWFDYNFKPGNNKSGLEIGQYESLIEKYYTNYLHSVENNKIHKIYFVWTSVSTEPLNLNLKAYITPGPEFIKISTEGTSTNATVSDPPKPPPPPPPY